MQPTPAPPLDTGQPVLIDNRLNPVPPCSEDLRISELLLRLPFLCLLEPITYVLTISALRRHDHLDILNLHL